MAWAIGVQVGSPAALYWASYTALPKPSFCPASSYWFLLVMVVATLPVR